MALSPANRRLTAVMLADVAGYTRLMSVDEDGTRERIAGFVTELIDATLIEHGGRLVKKMGDGTLAEFGSALDAVRCGLEIQRHLREQQQCRTDAIQLRIGINTGDVIVDERDIYGHVINVAARLESVAQPGSICVSQSIYDQTRGQPGLRFVDKGLHRLKNIREPIRVFDVSYGQAVVGSRMLLSRKYTFGAALVIAAVAVVGSLYAQRPQESIRDNSILVLPFRNLSSSTDDEYFADAITDDLTTDLSRLSRAYVIASATAMTYKNRPLDVRAISKDCDVRYLLEGTIRRKEQTIQTNVQLIDASTGRNVWADRFSYESDSLAKLEAVITSHIGSSLDMTETRPHSAAGGSSFASSSHSLDDRMRAMAVVLGTPTPERYAVARQVVEDCVKTDPDSSRCWSVLARIIMTDYLNSWNGVGLSDVARAEAAYRRTLDLDPGDAGAHYAAGLVFRVRGEHERSLAELEKAVALDPNLVVAEAQLANAFVFLGRIKEAIAAAKRAIDRSPRDPSIGVFYWVLGRAYFTGGDYKDAAAWLERSVQERHNLWFSQAWLISARSLAAEHDAARQRLDAFRTSFPEYTYDRIREIYSKEPQYDNPTIAAAREHLFQGLTSAGLK